MKKLKSILTDDMNTCYATGRTGHIEVHHIFGAFNRKRSEKYGFVVPLHAEVHPNGAFCTLDSKSRKELDYWLKSLCQEYFLKNIGTRDEWYQEFGRFYDADGIDDGDLK